MSALDQIEVFAIFLCAIGALTGFAMIAAATDFPGSRARGWWCRRTRHDPVEHGPIYGYCRRCGALVGANDD